MPKFEVNTTSQNFKSYSFSPNCREEWWLNKYTRGELSRGGVVFRSLPYNN